MLISPVGDVGNDTVAALILSVRRGGKIGQQGRFSCDAEGMRDLSLRLKSNSNPQHLMLALPEVSLLDKTLLLPAAVEPDLDRVLGYEMDVETPFSADEVYWNWSVDGRDRVHGKVIVTLALLPRAILSGLLGLLHRHGISPQEIAAPRADGTTVFLPLEHVGKVGEGARRRPSRLAWGVCLGLAVLAVVLPFLQQSIERNTLEKRSEAVRALANEARALQSRLDGTAGGGGAIILQRRQFADPLRVLAELTQALPDDTVITDFSLKGHKLTVAGQSSSATRLIGILAANSLFHDPSFASPVTRVGPESGALEVFSLTAEVGDEP